ncbi:Carboxypeptidase regulatory-like domain protein [uncultured archaeon]|nr:Carboxypeptidase regulatory-like domain protein [uncultured archaeon]
MAEEDVEEGSLKEKYYQFMDWLEDHNVKSYEYFVNPLEDNNVPSFPVFIAICLLFALGIGLGFYYLLSSSGTSNYSFTVSFNGTGNYTGMATIIVGGQTYSQQVTDSNAVFTNLPNGLADITAQIDGQSTDFQASSVQTNSGEYVFQVGSLGFSGQLSVLQVQVSDAQTSNLIQNAKITVFTSSNPVPIVQTTPQNGIVTFNLNQGDVVQVSISATGYQSSISSIVLTKPQHNLDIHLTPKVSCTTPDCLAQNQKVDVRVQLQDSTGNNLNLEFAKVQLMYIDSNGQTLPLMLGNQPVEQTTDATGSTHFDQLAIVGLNIFVAVLPPDGSGYTTYNGVSESQVATTSNNPMQFTPQLSSSSNAAACIQNPSLPQCQNQIFSTGQIKLTVLDSTDNSTISGADVNLYYNGGISPVPFQDKTTDSNGQVAWDAASGSYYATIIKDGYLPGFVSSLQVGSDVTFNLQKALIGNSQQLQVLVTDDNDNPVQGAQVSLYYAGSSSTGAATGLTGSTGTDGIAYFDNVPIDDNQYTAVATASSSVGQTTFKMDFSNPKQVVVKIEPETVPFSVQVKDAITRTVIPGALVAVTQQLASQTTPVQGTTDATGTASLTLTSQIASTLSVSAPGYLSYFDLTSFTLEPGKKTSKIIYLTPTSFQSNLGASLTISQTLGNTDDSVLVRGQYYNLKLSLSTPSVGDYALGFVRVGDAQSVSDEDVVITQPDSTLQNPSGINVGVQALRKVSFGDIAPCQVGGSVDEFKWTMVNYTPSVSSTTVNPSIIYVKPTGTQKKIRVYYGALVVKDQNSVLYEYPDTANAYQSVKDVCLASLSYKDYPIQAQDSMCNDQACLYVNFNGLNGRQDQAIIGQPYVLNVKASEFQSLDSPKIRIIDESQNLVFNSYTLTDANGGPVQFNPATNPVDQDVNMTPFVADVNALPQTPAAVNLTLTPKNKATSTILTVQLLSADNVILQRRMLIKLSGNQIMQATLLSIDSPSAQAGNVINVNEPAYLTFKLTKTIPDEQGVFEPVTDAFAQPQNKDLQNKPFGSLTQAGLQGDGSTNKGQDGIYKILAQPILPGLFNIQFTEPDYVPLLSQDISVIASQFLQVNPDENVGLSLSGDTCNQAGAQKIQLFNTLAAAIDLTIQPDQPGCLAFSAPGLTCNAASGSCTFSMIKGSLDKPSLKTISVFAGVNPNPNCFIQITATVPGAVGQNSQSTLNVPVQSNCPFTNYTNSTISPFAKLCVTDDDCGPYASTGTCEKQTCTYDPAAPANQVGGCPFYGGQTNYCTATGNCNVGVCNCNDIISNKYLEGFSDSFLTYYLMNEFSSSDNPRIANPGDSPYITLTDYGLQNNGISSTTLSIDPLTQSDGFAITFDNQASRTLTLSTQITGDNSQCLVFNEDTSSDKNIVSYLYVKNLIDWLTSSSSFSSSGFSIPAGKIRTFTVLFDPTKPGCDYDSIKPSTITLTFGSLSTGTQKATLNIAVKKFDSQQLKLLTKIQVPSNGSLIPRRLVSSQEPVLTVDNSKKLNAKFAYLETNKAKDFVFQDPTNTYSIKGDVLGSLIDNNKDSVVDCQKNNYCLNLPTYSEYSSAANSLLNSKNPSTVRHGSVSAGNKMLESAVAALYDTANQLCSDVNALYCLFNVTPSISTGANLPQNQQFNYYNTIQNPLVSGYYGSNPYGYGGYIGYPQQNPYGYGGFQGPGIPDPIFGYSGCNFQQVLNLICDSLRSPTRFRSTGASKVLSILGGSFVTSLCRANILTLVYQARSRQIVPGQYAQYGGPIPGILGPGYNPSTFAMGLPTADRTNFDAAQVSRAFATQVDVHVPYKFAGDTGGFRVSDLSFTFGDVNEFKLLKDSPLSDYSSYLTSTVQSLSGYPYDTCTTGTCQIKYDGYKPTLYTFAKYKIKTFGIAPKDYSLFNPNDYLSVKTGPEVNLYRCDILKLDPTNGMPVYSDPDNCKLPSSITNNYVKYVKEGKTFIGVHVVDKNIYFVTNYAVDKNLETYYVGELKSVFEYFYNDTNGGFTGDCKTVRENDDYNLILSCGVSDINPSDVTGLFAYIYNESNPDTDDLLSTTQVNNYPANKPVYLWIGYDTNSDNFSDIPFTGLNGNNLILSKGTGTSTSFNGNVSVDPDGYLFIDPNGKMQNITISVNALGKSLTTTVNFTAPLVSTPQANLTPPNNTGPKTPDLTDAELQNCTIQLSHNFNFAKSTINWIQINNEATYQEWQNAVGNVHTKKLSKLQKKTVADYNKKESAASRLLLNWNRNDPISIVITPDPNPLGYYDLYFQDGSDGKFKRATTFDPNAAQKTFSVIPTSNGPFKIVLAVRDPTTNKCIYSRFWSYVNTIKVKK